MARAGRPSKNPVKPGRNRPIPTEQTLRQRQGMYADVEEQPAPENSAPGDAGGMNRHTRTGPLAGVSQDQDNVANETVNPDPRSGSGAELADEQLSGGIEHVAHERASKVATRSTEPKRSAGSREDERGGGGSDRGRGATKRPRG